MAIVPLDCTIDLGGEVKHADPATRGHFANAVKTNAVVIAVSTAVFH